MIGGEKTNFDFLSQIFVICLIKKKRIDVVLSAFYDMALKNMLYNIFLKTFLIYLRYILWSVIQRSCTNK